ncbi:MAG: hypothetical protein ABSF95_05075 [Verrucomicrobiota bacterium]|jgi:hypothetical protein
MTRLQLGIISAVLAAGGVVSWSIDHSARMELRKKTEACRQQADLLALWSAENEALSNLLAQGKNRLFLSNEQIRELMRLRSQAGQLHRTAMEADELRAGNQRLLAALARSGTNGIHLEGESLAFTGFADPESALKSTLWAWINGDRAAFLASFAPEERAALEKEWQQASETEIAADCRLYAPLYGPAAEGVSVLGKKGISANEAVIDIYFEGDGKTRKFVLKKFGEEWKVTGLQLIFN